MIYGSRPFYTTPSRHFIPFGSGLSERCADLFYDFFHFYFYCNCYKEQQKIEDKKYQTFLRECFSCLLQFQSCWSIILPPFSKELDIQMNDDNFKLFGIQ